jgi:hypothetical protein
MPRGPLAKRSTEPSVIGPPGTIAGRTFIAPSATTNAAVVAAVLAGNKDLQFGVGQYGLEAPLFTGLTPAELSGVDIQGEGRDTVLEPTYVSPAGQASTPTNAVVLVQGAVVPATYNSVLTRHAIIGDRTIAVALSAAALVGTWLRLNGHNDPATAMGLLQAGANITATEIVKVLSTAGGGLVVTLDGVLLQEHTITNGGTGLAQSVQAVSPVQKFRLANMRIVGTAHQIAVGVLLDYVVEPILEDLWFEGFSLADYFSRLGTRGCKYRRLTHLGGSNCWGFIQSSCGGLISQIDSPGTGDRVHPLGTLQGLYNFAWNATDWDMSDFVLRRGCRGLQIAACMQLDFSDGLVDDMLIPELLARPAIAESSFCGIGLDTGRGPLPDTAFSVGVTFDKVRFSNCRSNGPIDVDSPYAVFFHDVLDCVADVQVENLGESPYAVVDGLNYVMQGVNFLDSSGIFRLDVRGSEFGCTIRSSSGGMRLEHVRIRSNSGAGTVTTVGVYQFKLGGFNGISFGRLESEPACSYSNASPGDRVTVESYNLIAAQYEYRDTQTFVNGTGALLQFGDLFEIDPAGVQTVYGPVAAVVAGAGVPLGVCCEGGAQAVNGNAFDGVPLPSPEFVVNCTAAAVVPNDLLDWGAGNAAKANNAAVLNTAIGRATSFKAAGAAGAVRGTSV